MPHARPLCTCPIWLTDPGRAQRALNGGRLSLPVLFVNGDYDQMNTIAGNWLGDSMRVACVDLTVTSLPAAHWLPLEREAEVVQAIRTWLHRKGSDGGIGRLTCLASGSSFSASAVTRVGTPLRPATDRVKVLLEPVGCEGLNDHPASVMLTDPSVLT